DDRDLSPRLHVRNPVQPPAFSDTLWNVFEHRNVVIQSQSETMARVKSGRPVLRVQVVGVLRQSRGREVEVDAVGGIVQGFRPDIRRKSRKSMPALAA